MNIKILDSWLREHLITKAKPKDIAKALSLTSASVEKIEEFKKDYIYHIEITTNRIDLASITGIAREVAAVLPQFGFNAEYKEQTAPIPHTKPEQMIVIHNNDKLVKRICCAILEVTKKESPQYIKDRLESAGIRYLNNLIDVTNYIMLETGHPTHAFDYDRLTTKKLIIRESRKGEKIITLDKKEHTLIGGDIVADNGKGEIVDLLGVMGTTNSVVNDQTKRILFFIDNTDPIQIRRTSMSLNIRTDAAAINEKNVDPELAMTALLRGIELYKEIADAKIVSNIIDIYPRKWKPKTITISEEKINQVIGVNIPLKDSEKMLRQLNFEVKLLHKENKQCLEATIPSYRDSDIHIAEDLIEEIARMYGYHNLPNQLPASTTITPHHYTSEFFWEKHVKEALRYWGFTEVYTYSMVSEELFQEPLEQAITLKNPLDEEHVHLRKKLIPSLLEVINQNKSREVQKNFELANVYHKRSPGLPEEIQTLAAIIKDKNEDFFTVKGTIEQIATNLGIKLIFQTKDRNILIYLQKEYIGNVEIIQNGLIAFELNFALLAKHATLKKIYRPIAKYPSMIEDMAFTLNSSINTGDIIDEIKKQSPLIKDVSLLDKFENTRTFHIIYQSKEGNLTNKEVEKIRNKILEVLKEKFSAYLKS